MKRLALRYVDEPEPEPEEVKEEPKEEAKEPEKAEPKKKKLRKVVDPDIPEAVAKQPVNQNIEIDPLDDPDEQEFMETLIPEEKVVYEKILYADKKLGGEYKGKSEKFKTFFKKNKDYLDKKMAEDEFYDPSR